MLPGMGNSPLATKLFCLSAGLLCNPRTDSSHASSPAHLLLTHPFWLLPTSFGNIGVPVLAKILSGSQSLLGSRPQPLPWPAILVDLYGLTSSTVPHTRALSHSSCCSLTRPGSLLPWPPPLYVVNSCTSLRSPASFP